MNEGDTDARIRVKFADLGLAQTPASVRDVWAHKTWVSSPHPMRQRLHRTGRVYWKSEGENLRYQAWYTLVRFTGAAFNRIDTSPYASNIAVNAAPPRSRATVSSPPVPTDAVIADDLLAPSVSGPIKIAGTTYAEGFGILGAPAQIAYRLDGHCSRFAAKVGVDDSGAIPGAVSFQVWGDGKMLFDSGIMQKGLPAQGVSVDVSK